MGISGPPVTLQVNALDTAGCLVAAVSKDRDPPPLGAPSHVCRSPHSFLFVDASLKLKALDRMQKPELMSLVQKLG